VPGLVNIGLQKGALIQSNNVANKSLNSGGDITPLKNANAGKCAEINGHNV